MKSRDRSNPPVTAKVLNEITKRWGVAKTKWVVELCFDDLLEWNTWMFENRREVCLHRKGVPDLRASRVLFTFTYG